jgi:hypothetical protein
MDEDHALGLALLTFLLLCCICTLGNAYRLTIRQDAVYEELVDVV